MTPASLLQLFCAGQAPGNGENTNGYPRTSCISSYAEPDALGYCPDRYRRGCRASRALLVPFCGIPLVVIGIALIIWRGREDVIDEIKE